MAPDGFLNHGFKGLHKGLKGLNSSKNDFKRDPKGLQEGLNSSKKVLKKDFKGGSKRAYTAPKRT